MKKTNLMIAVLTAAAAAVLWGCNGGAETSTENTEGGTSTAQGGQETVTLEMLLCDDTLEGGAMAAVVEKFNEEFKDQGIQVEINEIANADMPTQIMNRASVGELPALVKYANFNDYIDYVLPLDDIGLKQEDFNRNCTRNGKFMATPVNDTAVGLLINKTAFDEAGVSYPTTEEERWTWDEFIEAVQTVVDKSEKVTTGLLIDQSQQRINTVLYQFGMQYFDPEDSTKVIFRSDATRRGLEFLLSLYEEDGISRASVGVGTENAQDAFKTGTVAAHLAGNWVMTDYLENIKDFEWMPVLMPYETAKATCLGGNYLYAFDGTGVEEEAKTFIKWFYEPENYALYCQEGNYIPGKKNVEVDYKVDGIEIFQMEIEASIGQPQYDSDVQALEHSGESWENGLRDPMDRAIAGELDVEGVIDEAINNLTTNLTGLHE